MGKQIMIKKTHLIASMIFGFAIASGFALMFALSTTLHNQYMFPLIWAISSYLFYTRFTRMLMMLISTSITLGIFGVLMLPLFLVAVKLGWISKDVGFGIIALTFIPIYGLVVGFILLIVGTLAYFWIRGKRKKKIQWAFNT